MYEPYSNYYIIFTRKIQSYIYPSYKKDIPRNHFQKNVLKNHFILLYILSSYKHPVFPKALHLPFRPVSLLLFSALPKAVVLPDGMWFFRSLVHIQEHSFAASTSHPPTFYRHLSALYRHFPDFYWQCLYQNQTNTHHFTAQQPQYHHLIHP